MTAVTIRPDINSLAQSGLVIKIHGGAMSAEHRLHTEIPISQKMQQNVGKKRKIARRAATRIHPGDMIILDSGSTTLEIARLISSGDVTVITNDVLIAKVLISQGNVTVYMTGGRNLSSVYALHGSETEEYLKKVRDNKLFLGCDAVDFEWGISNRTLEEVATKRAMMQASREVIAVADSGKTGKSVFARLCGLNEIDRLINDELNDEDRENILPYAVENPFNADADALFQSYAGAFSDLRQEGIRVGIKLPNVHRWRWVFDWIGLRFSKSMAELEEIFRDGAAPCTPTPHMPDLLAWLRKRVFRPA